MTGKCALASAFVVFALLAAATPFGIPEAHAGKGCKWAEKALQNLSEKRNAVFRQIKRDANLPQTLQPIAVRHVPMTDGFGHQLWDEFHQPIMSREYDFVRPSDGMKITIQEHTAGQHFPDGGFDGPHFNVRPTDELRHGVVPGTKPHYNVDLDN